ncbi:MAG: hypothetical protein U0X93_08265 [Anaerolineales bacterium]
MTNPDEMAELEKNPTAFRRFSMPSVLKVVQQWMDIAEKTGATDMKVYCSPGMTIWTRWMMLSALLKRVLLVEGLVTHWMSIMR